MRPLLSLLLGLALLGCAAEAKLKDLTIDADRVSLEKDKQRLEASGSVEVKYKDFHLTSAHLIYNTSAETLQAEDGFQLNYSGLTFEGASLAYDINSQKGTATGVSFHYGGMEVDGGWIGISRERLELKSAGFTTCELEHPHYRVTAANLTLYPEYGWLVAYWGYFWLNGLPVVPMPTYIYDFRASERAQKNLPPFPEVGFNDDDGTYINERLAWHQRREFSGTYSLGYAANKGLLLGATANYSLNERNVGDIRLDWNGVNGLFGGVTNLYSFGGESTSTEKPLFDFVLAPRLKQYELAATISYKERINYQRVSLTPDIHLRSQGGQFFTPLAKYDLELQSGLVKEEGTGRYLRGGGQFKVYADLPGSIVTPALRWDSLYYSNGAKWVKPSALVDLGGDLGNDVNAHLGYQHYFFFDGQSPFLFEMYRFRAADRLLPDLRFRIGETACRVKASYFLDNWSPEDIDYTLFFRLHCYNLEVTYRSMRREFMLGFSLAAS
ncbi:MAG: hypothetical protein WC632_07590 [Candidatus Margulisiibacteriota bacterium]